MICYCPVHTVIMMSNCDGQVQFRGRFDHEIFFMVIRSLPLIQEGQLSVSGKRMCTLLVNSLEDSLPSKSLVR